MGRDVGEAAARPPFGGTVPRRRWRLRNIRCVLANAARSPRRLPPRRPLRCGAPAAASPLRWRAAFASLRAPPLRPAGGGGSPVARGACRPLGARGSVRCGGRFPASLLPRRASRRVVAPRSSLRPGAAVGSCFSARPVSRRCGGFAALPSLLRASAQAAASPPSLAHSRRRAFGVGVPRPAGRGSRPRRSALQTNTAHPLRVRRIAQNVFHFVQSYLLFQSVLPSCGIGGNIVADGRAEVKIEQNQN